MSEKKLHVAIIMDGNSRWAKINSVSQKEGHMKGAQALKKLLSEIGPLSVSHLTLFAFSHENWQRSCEEINYLMNLISLYLEKEKNKFHDNNIKLQVIGDREKLPLVIQKKIASVEKLTKNNNALTVTLALGYGAKQEIIQAVKKICACVFNKEIDIDQINESLFNNFLYDPQLSDPDILIRTGGDQRLSNFLLWQISYSEIFFIEEYWPDFNADLLNNIITQFYKRERRYGKRND